MNKVYERNENGSVTTVSVKEAMIEANHAMMDGKREVKAMSAGSGRYDITYKDGRRVVLVPVEVSEEPEPDDVNVISYSGGKVHTAMPGMPEGHAYPLCRGGGMNQHLTKFRIINAPLTCKTCLTYAERRAARRAEERG